MNNKTTTTKGEGVERASLCAVSPMMQQFGADSIRALATHHREHRYEFQPGKFISEYLVEDFPLIVVLSDEAFTVLAFMTEPELNDLAAPVNVH